ncbi:MAG: hypothetical protein CMJ58_02835 [Planctomycetaceae bacterium]|nr:hypothetical protein [Planctomycetaceae bacterium]
MATIVVTNSNVAIEKENRSAGGADGECLAGVSDSAHSQQRVAPVREAAPQCGQAIALAATRSLRTLGFTSDTPATPRDST